MKNDKFIPGLILVLIGLTFLLANFGYINFHWENILHLWPIFLIIAGVNLVFAHNNTPIAYAAKIGVIILGFGLLLFGNFGDKFNWPGYTYSWHNGNHNHDHDNNDSDDDDDDDDDDTTGIKGVVKVDGVSNFNLPYTTDAKTAELHISGGGTQYNLSDTTNELFKADTKEHFSSYELSHSNSGANYVLNFDMKDKKNHNFNWGNDNKNAVSFKLNTNPIWSVYVEAGAAGLDFDLSKYKVQKVKLSGGAASFKVKLGQPLATTDVEVSTGMASVNIAIPQNAACEIETDSGLSSNNFDGFTKTDDGHYQTPGFATAKNKIHIDITGGMSDFRVTKY